MGRLILINGAPGSGKSTLGRRYVQDHPLVLALEIDVVRGLLGRWLDQPVPAGQLARRLALVMAAEHLHSGHDVIIPQFLGRIEFVLALQQLCDDSGTQFIETALLGDPAEAAERFARRAAAPETAEHRDAAALLERMGGLAALPRMYEQLLAVIASRPSTRTVTTMPGNIDQTYSNPLAQIRA